MSEGLRRLTVSPPETPSVLRDAAHVRVRVSVRVCVASLRILAAIEVKNEK